jgi:hypothetical protein
VDDAMKLMPRKMSKLKNVPGEDCKADCLREKEEERRGREGRHGKLKDYIQCPGVL